MKPVLPDMNILAQLPARGPTKTWSAALKFEGSLMRMSLLICAALLAAILSGCGGGGTRGAAVCIPGVSTMAFPNGCPGDDVGGTVGVPTLTLSLKKDASNTAVTITQVSPAQPGTLQAVVKDSAGKERSGVSVTFTTSDKTGGLVPASGTALTNDKGEASVLLPVGVQAGAFTARANAIVGGEAISGTFDYAVTFPKLSLGEMTFGSPTISANGTTLLEVTVLDDSGPFKPAQSVSFSSPCTLAGKASIGSPVVTVGGVASASYTDKGCGGPDTITATTTLAGATATQTGTLTVLGATAGQIAFVSALPQNIAMKGTGGPGRQESSTVTFKVLDSSGNPTGGVKVDFFVFSNTGTTSGTGGLTLNPSTGTTAADGTVSTVVSAGIVNTPVRISASVSGTSPAVTSISDQLVISTGIPDQNSFTASPAIYNIECGNHDVVLEGHVTAFVADHFNNPVPDGTAVSFTTEGGAIDASCLTGLKPPDAPTTLVDGKPILQKGVPGQCTVRFICQNPRPADGRITVLAYALGEETFWDVPEIKDGINRYDLGEPFVDLREPFRYDRAMTNGEARVVNLFSAPNPNDPTSLIRPAVGEPFIDSNGDGLWNDSGDGFYNGVLQAVPNGKPPTVHVRDSFVLVFSTSTAKITPLSELPLELNRCTNGTPFNNYAKTLGIAVRDTNSTTFPENTMPGNILPAGTVIAFRTSNGTILSNASFTVPNTNEPNEAAWTYYLSIQSDATQTGPGTTSNGVTEPGYVCSNPVSSGLLTVTVTTPFGVTTTQSFTIND